MPDAPAPPIGRYEIVGELGRGAMGVVYQARDPQLGRVVAIKTLRADLGLPPEEFAKLKKRFYQEATAAGRLTHPGIVAIHDVIELEDTPYIVMEFIEGRTLADLLATEGAPDPHRAVAIVRQICAALEYAHAHGVVHRDIKPANILVGPGEAAKLGDFGIARITGSEATRTGVVLGTPGYLAPEQIRGERIDGRGDLFSLGVVLYEALTGVNPFKAEDLATVLYRIVHETPVPACERNPAIPPALSAVVERAMAKEPDARYATASAFADALARGLEPPTAGGEMLRRARGLWGRPGAWPWLAVATAACLVGLGVGTWALRGREAGQDGARTARVASRPAEPSPRPETATPSPPPRRHEEATTPAPPAPPQPAPGSAARATPDRLGTIMLTTNPSVEVFLDGAFRGRTGDTPLLLADVPAGERLVTLRLGKREETLRGRVRDGQSLAMTYRFQDEPREPAPDRPPAVPPGEARAPRPAPPSDRVGCLSVNAVPFASVHADGQYVGDTPRACLRVPVGEHRIHFEAGGQRSPERVVQVTEQHTPAAPLRLSYDFRLQRFLEP